MSLTLLPLLIAFGCQVETAPHFSAPPALTKGAIVYENFPYWHRPLLIESYVDEVARRKRALTEAQQRNESLTGLELEKAVQKQREMATSLTKLEERNAPPFIGIRLNEHIGGVAKYKSRYLWDSGDIGIAYDSFVVRMVVDDSTAVLERQNQAARQHRFPRTANQIFYLKNHETKGWQAGEIIKINDPLWISGEKVTTALPDGLFLEGITIEPFDWVRYRKTITKESLIAPKEF